jgi:hypothetical protein
VSAVVVVSGLLSRIVKPSFVTDATNESYHHDSGGGKMLAHWPNPRLV